MIERSQIQFGHTKIPFGVQRSARRKTVSLAVDSSGDLTVTAPPDVPLVRLQDVVRTKAPWVVAHVKRASDRPPPMSAREFVTGETVLYLGRHYRLKVERRANVRTSLNGGWLRVSDAHGSIDERRRLVSDWLCERAREYLLRRIGEVCARHSLKAPNTIVGEPKARWGSCDARGTVRLNWRIVQAPVSLIDYVLLHELTHLSHPGHDRDFWAALGRRMPDYETRRERLRRLGPDLVW